VFAQHHCSVTLQSVHPDNEQDHASACHHVGSES